MKTMPFNLVLPSVKPVPLLVSVPHCGVEFPGSTADQLMPQQSQKPADTDWFVDQLYDFVPKLGGSLLTARFSRYLIDLNRSPEDENLYEDGRKETSLVPEFSFSGESLYRSDYPNQDEIRHRYDSYYLPYHNKIRTILDCMLEESSHVLLFDAHSIKSKVDTIQSEPFADLTLGDQNGKTAHVQLIEVVERSLRKNSHGYSYSHNHPFRGGYITRKFGQPKNNVHALQLEMSQKIYMDEDSIEYHHDSAGKVKSLLEEVLTAAIEALEQLK